MAEGQYKETEPGVRKMELEPCVTATYLPLTRPQESSISPSDSSKKGDEFTHLA